MLDADSCSAGGEDDQQRAGGGRECRHCRAGRSPMAGCSYPTRQRSTEALPCDGVEPCISAICGAGTATSTTTHRGDRRARWSQASGRSKTWPAPCSATRPSPSPLVSRRARRHPLSGRTAPLPHGGQSRPRIRHCRSCRRGERAPGPRAQALLEQIRERELEQAVARLRLVHGREGRPATVYLLSNLPLNLGVSELTTWNALMRDRRGGGLPSLGWRVAAALPRASRCAPDLWATPEGGQGVGDGERGCQTPLDNILEHFDTPFPSYPAWGSTSLNRDSRDAGRVPSYPRRRGPRRTACIPGELWCEFTARAHLEEITGSVASLRLVGIVHRDRPDELRPVSVPEAQAEPPPRVSHVLPHRRGLAIGRTGLERWNLHSGHEILMPVELGRECSSRANVGGAPTSFARTSPSG